MIPTVLLVLACAFQVAFFEEYVIPDNIDVDEILANDRLLKNYVNCLLEKGKCTPEGERLRKAIPEALQNECAKCNEKVKENVRKVILHISKKMPETWKEVQAKFDPNGEFKEKYKNLIEKEGIPV